MEDEGCWIIQLVKESEPWRGTRVSPYKRHAFQPIAPNDFDTLRCSTCGMVKDRSGKVLSVVTPELEPAREPTEAELAKVKS